jgi:hypothetical protein
MYSRVGEYRIGVTVRDEAGQTRAVNPTALAPSATPSTAGYLVGADHWRSGPSLLILRTHLGDVAEWVCRQQETSRAVDVVLRERRPGHAERTTSTHRRCAP